MDNRYQALLIVLLSLAGCSGSKGDLKADTAQGRESIKSGHRQFLTEFRKAVAKGGRAPLLSLINCQKLKWTDSDGEVTEIKSQESFAYYYDEIFTLPRRKLICSAHVKPVSKVTDESGRIRGRFVFGATKSIVIETAMQKGHWYVTGIKTKH